MLVLGPVFGETYRRAKASNSSEEFIRSKEAASAAAAWGTTFGMFQLGAAAAPYLLTIVTLDSWFRASELRRWCPHQRYRDPVLQGRCLLGWFDFLGTAVPLDT